MTGAATASRPLTVAVTLKVCRSWCRITCELGGDRRGAGPDEPAERSVRQVALHEARHTVRIVLPQVRAAVRGARDRLAHHKQVTALLGEHGRAGGGA
jgi:hypothetical protein